MKVHALFLVFATAILVSCSSDIVYSRFYPVFSERWHADSLVHFEYRIEDISSTYQLLVYVRHSECYPYQNMWLFLGDSLHRDTIEFYLADDRGQWLGDTHNGFIEMPILLDENRHYTDTGMYYLDIQHGMRDTLLRGITDIGLEISKNGQE